MFLFHLKEECRIIGIVADWRKSYLIGRCQPVEMWNIEKMVLGYQFPLGSRLGLFGFRLHTTPLTAIGQECDVQIHFQADDTQLYLSLNAYESQEAIKWIEECVMTGIGLWMARNFVKLSDTKAELVMFGSSKDLVKVKE